MDQETKKLRFIKFIDETIAKSCSDINEKVNFTSNDQILTLKVKVKDIGLTRYIAFQNKNFNITEKNLNKIDCCLLFDRANTLHKILIGKVLPYSVSLIGKFEMIFFNEKGKFLTSIYNPAKKNYAEIIKGTRFTLKKEAISNKV